MSRSSRSFIEITRQLGVGLLFLLYPVIHLFYNPVHLVQALSSVAPVFGLRSRIYSHFNPLSALNCLFYWIIDDHLKQHGRSGFGRWIGFGAYPLRNLFHYSSLSMHLFVSGGARYILISMLLWVLSFWLHMNQGNVQWTILVTSLLLISTSFQMLTFRRQNYHALAWVFVPIVIILKDLSLPIPLAGALLIISGISTTVTVIGVLLVALTSIFDRNIMLLSSVVPSLLVLFAHLIPIFRGNGRGFDPLITTAKAIGLSRRKVAFRRKYDASFRKSDLYLAVLHIQFFYFSSYFIADGSNSLILVSLCWFYMNKIVRFADTQNMHMLILTSATIGLIHSQHPILLVSYWLLVSPPPVVFGIHTQLLREKFWKMPKFYPFNVDPFLAKIADFLRPVEEKETILFSMSDPKGTYESLFDGFVPGHQALNLVSSRREILVIPNVWGIYEANADSHPSMFGRSVSEVLENMSNWGSRYVIAYACNGNPCPLDNALESGLEKCGILSWEDYALESKVYGLMPEGFQQWHLYRLKSESGS